jgi:hypothetical protein
MDPVGGVVLTIVVIAGALVTRAVSKARGAARSTLARDLGFHYVRGAWYEPERLVGTYQGVHVEIEYAVRSNGDSNAPFTRVIASGPHPEVQLSSAHFVERLMEPFKGRDVPTGDKQFDDAVMVRGPSEGLVGLLDPATRAAVASFAAAGHRVAGGKVTADASGLLVTRVAVEPLLAQAARVAARLRPGFLSGDALARIAIEDVEPGIRRNALQVLRAGDEALAKETHARARDDWDPAVRIDALLYLRDYAAIEALPPVHVAAWAALEPESVVHVLRHFTSEAALVPLLRFAELHDLVCARLAAVGGDAAVVALRDHAAGLLGTGRSAREAIDAIHARLGRAPGTLSIAATDGGALSEAPAGGALSEATTVGTLSESAGESPSALRVPPPSSKGEE